MGYARARVGDAIEPAALCHYKAYREFLNNKSFVKINYDSLY